MDNLDFNTKISAKRPWGAPGKLQVGVESDRGRIINSAAIRRLQQKTQVFPLERNAAVRSRLTHSMEVQQVGRFISQKIVQQLKWSKKPDYGFIELERSIESLVEMACLMHDIGNPPFGHFGEKAIGDWFEENLKVVATSNPGTALVQLQEKMKVDLLNFEGNAQAIRLISSLLKLNLTYTQAAAILKYTRPAYLPKSGVMAAQSYLMKKPGYYLSEESYVQDLQQNLQMDYGCRHPLSYIMEAADDISYCYADIEDAVEKDILTVEQLYVLLIKAYKDLEGDPEKPEFELFGKPLSFMQLLDDAKDKFDKEDIDKDNKFFINLRVKLNHILTNHAVERFIDNITEVYHGTFNNALLEDDSPAHKLAETFKMVAFAHVFSHKEVELQELRGYRVLQGLLDYYKPLLDLSGDDFQGLLAKDRDSVKKFARQSRLVNKLPGKHRRAYEDGLKGHKGNILEYPLWEYYYRCRLMQDFVSGMTDQYALDEYQSLMVTD
jgi:dGTPase